MLRDIIKKEIQDTIMSPRFVFTFLLCTILILLSIYTGINNYQAELKEHGAAVSLNKKISKVQPFVDKNKLTFTILIDKKYKSLDLFRILIIPTTFIVDKNGILKNIYVDFDENIQKVLEKEVKKL